MTHEGRTISGAQPERVEVGGVALAYLESGPRDGELVVCLHGFPDVAPTWQHLLARLAGAGYRAIAPWLRGYAPSGLAPDGNYQTGSLALDALGLADALAPDRPFVLVGHDWGALAAYVAAGHAPERLRRLVAMAVPHPTSLVTAMISNVAQLKRGWYQFFFQTPLAEVALPNDDFALVDVLWRDWSPGFEPDPAHLRQVKDALAEPARTVAALSMYRYVLGTLPTDPTLAEIEAGAYGPIAVPTLYLHGADDGVMGVELVDEAALTAVFPSGLEVVVLPGCGHFLHLERPDDVADRILGFLAS